MHRRGTAAHSCIQNCRGRRRSRTWRSCRSAARPAISVADRRSAGAAAARDRGACDTGDGRGSAISLRGRGRGATISDNTIFAPVGMLANDPHRAARRRRDQTPFLLAAALADRRQHPLVPAGRRSCSTAASLHLLGTRIAGNEVVGCCAGRHQRAGRGAGRVVDEHQPATASPSPATASAAACDGAWIDDNKLRQHRRRQTTRPASRHRAATGLDQHRPDQCQILANQIERLRPRRDRHRRAGARADRQAQHHRELRQRHRLHRRRQCRLGFDREQSSAQHRSRAREARRALVVGHRRRRAPARRPSPATRSARSACRRVQSRLARRRS